MTAPGTPTADLPTRWRAHAWAEYARGRADLAALLWACADDLTNAQGGNTMSATLDATPDVTKETNDPELQEQQPDCPGSGLLIEEEDL